MPLEFPLRQNTNHSGVVGAEWAWRQSKLEPFTAAGGEEFLTQGAVAGDPA